MVAGFFFILAIACGIPLVMKGGWPILLIGFISVLLGYAYTGGPFPLAYLGLGDLFVIFFFGIIAVCGLTYLHMEEVSAEAVVLGLQVGFHCTVLIAINNLRDIEGDSRVHKKTMPVRFGKTFARYEIAFLCLAPFVLQLYWFQKEFFLTALLGFISLPLAIHLIKLIFFNEPSPAYNQYLGKAAGLHLLFGILLSVGFVMSGP